MNFQDHSLDYVNQNRSNHTYRTNSSNATPPAAATASQVTVLHAPLPQQIFQHESSPSSLPTVVPYIPSSPSTAELDGPDRLFPQPHRQTQQPTQTQQRAITYQVAHPPVSPHQLVRFDPRQTTMTGPVPVDWDVSDFKDDLVREVDKSVTPGVDSTPFIQYALETMTKPREDERGVSAVYSSSSEGTNPVFRYLPSAIPGLFQPTQAYLPVNPGISELEAPELTSPEEELAALRRTRQRSNLESVGRVEPQLSRQSSRLRPPSSGFVRVSYSDSPEIPAGLDQGGPGEKIRMPDRFDQLEEAALPKPKRSPRDVANWRPLSEEFTDSGEAFSYPALTYRPWILRTQSLSLLAALCVLMIAMLMFAAIFSEHRNGLMVYNGTIYDGYYFLFRIFPQLLAALLLLYAQSVITAAFRILPFSALASDDLRSRRNVGFLPLYPKSFLWPQLISTWQVWIPIVITWILNFTIPLQSCVFTVVYVDHVWTWSTVQAVAWFLIALYFSMFMAAILLIIYWHNRRTGLVPGWDIRSLADIIALLAPSNSAQQFAGTETAAKRNDMRHMLYNNVERLGYWTSPDAIDLGRWYGVGASTNEEKAAVESLGDPVHEKGPRGQPPNVMPFQGEVRSRYLPWCFRNTQISFCAVSATILLIVLIVVCFNPATDVRNGFLPLLSAAPGTGAFSAADFLYSFLPALLGMVVFLLFQSLDLTLRILTPWGELSHKEGSLAVDSILLDYAACLPLESTVKALKHRHWRVALVSLLSTLSILIPVLSGGVFMALTATDNIVRMYPNVAVLGVVITLLVLTLFGIISLVFKRDQFRLPHAVTCLNEIISFCFAEELRADPAFQGVQNHRLLKQQLGVYMGNAEQSRWMFGTGYGKQEILGIRRYSKFTGNNPYVTGANQRAKTTREAAGIALRRALERDPAESQRRAISRPVPKGSTTMIEP